MLRANRPHNRFNHLVIKMFVALASALMAILVADLTVAPPDGTVSALVRLIKGAPPPPPPIVPLVSDLRWLAGQFAADEIRGARMSPYGWSRQYFDTDPRRYFAASTSRSSQLLVNWRVDHVPGRIVQVLRPDDPDWLCLSMGEDEPRTERSTAAILETRKASPLSAGRSPVVSLRIRSERPLTVTIQFLFGKDEQRLEESTFSVGPDITSIVQFGAAKSTEVEIRSRVLLDAGVGVVEISELAIEPAPPLAAGHDKPYYVDYRLNRLGYRDVDRTRDCPSDTLRIICLGDSNTFGLGVHFEDTYAQALERLCNQRRQPDADKVQALNFGVPGYATDAQYDVYVNDAAVYGGQVIFLQLCWNDAVSTVADMQLFRQTGENDARAYAEMFAAVIKENGFSRTIEYIHRLHEQCMANNAALVVGIFNDRDGWEWDAMVREVLPAMKAAGIPAFEFGPVADRSGLDVEERVVHPSDQHPNEKMHALFAQEIKRVLEELRLLPQ